MYLDSLPLRLTVIELIKSAWSDAVNTPMVLRLNPDMLPIMIASVDIEGMEIGEITFCH